MRLSRRGTHYLSKSGALTPVPVQEFCHAGGRGFRGGENGGHKDNKLRSSAEALLGTEQRAPSLKVLSNMGGLGGNEEAADSDTRKAAGQPEV